MGAYNDPAGIFDRAPSFFHYKILILYDEDSCV